MKIDAQLMLDGLRQAPEVCRAAEAIGFDAVWTTETKHEGMLPLALIGEHTKRLQFGTGIVIAFARSPMILAQASWDLAAQTGGRFILGLGTQVRQHVERRFGMAYEHPAPRLREMVLAIRAIWDCFQNGTRLDFRGEFYKLTLMTPFFNPGPIATPRVPIFVAGVNTALCQVAGEVADGFHVHPFHSARYLREVVVPAIAAGAAKAGRSRRDLELFGAAFVVTNEEERERARNQLSFYASTPTYRSVLALHGWSAVGERLSHLASRGRWDEMPKEITDEILETLALVARPEEVPAKLLAKYDGLLDRVGLYDAFEPGKNDASHRALVEGMRALNPRAGSR